MTSQYSARIAPETQPMAPSMGAPSGGMGQPSSLTSQYGGGSSPSMALPQEVLLALAMQNLDPSKYTTYSTLSDLSSPVSARNMALFKAFAPNATQETRAIQAQSGLEGVAQIRSILGGGRKGQIAKFWWDKGDVGRLMGGKEARQYADAAKEAYDIMTRLRTGAALNKSEQEFYAEYIPRYMDDPQTVNKKLARLESMYDKITKEGEQPLDLLFGNMQGLQGRTMNTFGGLEEPSTPSSFQEE